MSTKSLVPEAQFVEEITALVSRLRDVSFKTEADLANIILIAMTFMSTYTQLNGLSKKQIVIEALKQIVEDLELVVSTRTLLLNLIDTLAPGLIDVVFGVGGKKLFNSVGGLCGCFTAR